MANGFHSYYFLTYCFFYEKLVNHKVIRKVVLGRRKTNSKTMLIELFFPAK